MISMQFIDYIQEELNHGKLVHNLLVVMRNLQRRSHPLMSPGTGERENTIQGNTSALSCCRSVALLQREMVTVQNRTKR